MKLQVQVLYSEGCDHTPPTIDLLNEVASEIGIELELEKILVSDINQAKELNYFGSPTVRMNGKDIDPDARGVRSTGFS